MGIFDKLFGKKGRVEESATHKGKQPGKMTSNVKRVSGRFWKCPKCGAILRKSLFTMDVAKAGTSIMGQSTCICGAAFPMEDVYSGNYDIIVNVEIPSGTCPLRTQDGYCRKSASEETGKLLYACPWTNGSYVLDCAVYDTEFMK